MPIRAPSTTSAPAAFQLLEQPFRLSILAPPRVDARQKEPLLDSNNPPQGSAAKNRDCVQEQRNSLAPCSGFAARGSGSNLQAFPQKRSGDGAAQAQHRSGRTALSQDTKKGLSQVIRSTGTSSRRGESGLSPSALQTGLWPRLPGRAYSNTPRAKRGLKETQTSPSSYLSYFPWAEHRARRPFTLPAKP